MEIISTDDLAAYLAPLEVKGARADQVVRLTNLLITDEWQEPSAEDAIPVKVELLALTVAERAYTRKPGRAPLESETVAFDDSSRTQRYAVNPGDYERAGVFLTADELATLNGSQDSRPARAGSIRLGVPGIASCVGPSW